MFNTMDDRAIIAEGLRDHLQSLANGRLIDPEIADNIMEEFDHLIAVTPSCENEKVQELNEQVLNMISVAYSRKDNVVPN